jgi:hypothetical protein
MMRKAWSSSAIVVSISQAGSSAMAEKLRRFARVVGHSILAFVAAVSAGAVFQATLLPIVGKQRYARVAHDPVMLALMMGYILLTGFLVYRKWGDDCAFFAWIFQALWICHLALSRGFGAMAGKWSDRLFVLGIGTAYSVGAFAASLFGRSNLNALG